MIFENGQRLVMIGDSITDCGRARPVGNSAGLGNGYVSLVNALLSAKYPELMIEVLNTGISGNRVTDLRDRWQTDVLDLKPDWLSIMIGINDVWRHFDRPAGAQVAVGEYEQILESLIEQTLPSIKGLVLMTPYFIETNIEDSMRKMMDEYSAVVKKLADKYNTVFVDIQGAFNEYLKYRPTQTLCGDRVHPNLTGHMVIAEAFLATVE
jgi:lysophospholipase L1-like esterase